ncbi:MAG: GNAT family N-acetyltransferase, partial [Bacteroidetes bacterium]|nr:GNAT family N-acetyltransferase [Bacteroidota bacterium]
DELVTGFAVVDLVVHTTWALFVRPGYEGNGIGTILQQLLLTSYFQQTSIRFGFTSPGTRAETFYRKSGWYETGVYGKVKYGLKEINQIATRHCLDCDGCD